MSIAIEAMFNSSDIERAVMIFHNDNVLFTDILDFMDNHKSDEYISLSVDAGYIKIYAGKYDNVRKIARLPEILSNSFTTEVKFRKAQYPHLENAKIYANRNHFYFYGDCNGVIYQSHDITRDIIKQWCMEVANV